MISVIIVDYKQLALTKACIKSIEQTNYKDLEIIVIDNSVNNIGLAAAQNKGAKLAKGEWLFFLNNDTLVRFDIFDKLLKAAKLHDVVGCRMFTYDWKKELSSGVAVDRFGCPAGETGPVFYPDGAIFMRKSLFERVGGFDERLFLYGEDRDICWRIHLLGFSIGVSPSCCFAHASSCVSGDTFNTSFMRRRLAERNIIRSMIKNYSTRSLLLTFPQYFFWSFLELIVVFISMPAAIWRSYIPAYWWNIVNLKDTLKERKKVVRKVKDRFLPFSNRIGKLYVLQTMGVPKWKR